MANSSSQRSWVQVASWSLILLFFVGFFVYASGRYKDVPGCRLFYDQATCKDRSLKYHPRLIIYSVKAFGKSIFGNWSTLNAPPERVIGCSGKLVTRIKPLKPLNGLFKCK